MKVTLAFSPCPNDTFIFDALVNQKIDTGNLEIIPYLLDIETLNTAAAGARYDITKLSFPALFPQLRQYSILQSGAALGKGVGPLLVAKNPVQPENIPQCTVAIPGENTTANFLLSYAFPQVEKKIPLVFSAIEDAVCNGRADLGVIIHENRFTYQQKDLHKVCDLGELWEQRENAPLPLACIAIRRSLPAELKKEIDRLIAESVQYSFARYPQLSPYITSHAQAMEEDVMRKHIQLYVNNFSVHLGEEGRAAIQKFYTVYAAQKGTAPEIDLFG